MNGLFELAFARLDRAATRRRKFGDAWASYIAPHPWDAKLPGRDRTGDISFTSVAVSFRGEWV
ncbi:hypothetical protein [Micromonospora sp. NPDC005313]|uniref:hypothetical protein n=1 Tax=Micromonospora sp. NPDC005313 TaxID=3154296 RepID=UPI0033A314BF